MIKLAEILHIIKDERKKGLTPIDRWNILHVNFLEDMDFKADGIDHYSLEKPKIKVSHQKGVGFIVEDKSKGGKPHAFKTFKEMAEFFSTYKQKWENAPYQEDQNPVNEGIEQLLKNRKDEIYHEVAEAINSMGSHFFNVTVQFKSDDEVQYAVHVGQNFHPTVDWNKLTVSFRAK